MADHRLYITITSPFARKCRIVARERGVQNRVEEFDARIRTEANEVLAVSPLGKVPTLTGPNGLALTDSTAISEYLDRLAGPPALHGDAAEERLAASPAWALAEGLLESIAWRTREMRRPESERSPAFLAYERDRQFRVYDWLEARLADAAGLGRRDIAHIGLAIALDYGLYRFPADDWRAGRPKLTAWFATEAERPAFAETAPPPIAA